MLPSPKKVAKIINKALFQSEEEKRTEREIDRDVQVRMGKARIRRHIGHQKELVHKLTDLARRALALNDEPRFRQVGRQMLWTKGDIQRWEKYLLALEILEARRDQVKASVDLIQSVKSMSESLVDLTGPQNVTELQRELEEGLARAASLEERIDLMMDMMDETLSSDLGVEESALTDLESDLIDQVATQESTAYDQEIESGLRKIREEMEKSGK